MIDPLTTTERRIVEEVRNNAAVTGEYDYRSPSDFRREQRRLLAIIDRLTAPKPTGVTRIVPPLKD